MTLLQEMTRDFIHFPNFRGLTVMFSRKMLFSARFLILVPFAGMVSLRSGEAAATAPTEIKHVLLIGHQR